jgi:hypothetical protein
MTALLVLRVRRVRCLVCGASGRRLLEEETVAVEQGFGNVIVICSVSCLWIESIRLRCICVYRSMFILLEAPAMLIIISDSFNGFLRSAVTGNGAECPT